jgi:hypothetical protein
MLSSLDNPVTAVSTADSLTAGSVPLEVQAADRETNPMRAGRKIVFFVAKSLSVQNMRVQFDAALYFKSFH